MSGLSTLLLYELQKKYPNATLTDGEIHIPYRGKCAAVSIRLYCGSYLNGMLYSHARIDFGYYGKERQRDNSIYLRDLIECQDVEDGDPPKKIYGFVISPVVVSVIASACLKKIAPLFKRAKEKLDAEHDMAERAKVRSRQSLERIKSLVGDRVTATIDGGAVKIKYRDFSKTIYSTSNHDKVEVTVPLNKLADVLDFLAHGGQVRLTA
jgi:hypothetical protein